MKVELLAVAVFSAALFAGCSTRAEIGMVYYTDGSVSGKYKTGKTPAGIVAAVDDSGNTVKIMSLTEGEKLAVADASAQGYDGYFPVDNKDGSVVWTGITQTFEDARSNPASYPAFAWCSSCRDGEMENWYLPAREELAVIYRNYDVVKTSLEMLKAADPNGSAEIFGSDWFWTSSQVPDIAICTYSMNIKKGKCNDHYNKSRFDNVRAFHTVTKK